jgi:hypothetical protein
MQITSPNFATFVVTLIKFSITNNGFSEKIRELFPQMAVEEEEDWFE